MAYPIQHINIEIPHDSRDHVIVPDTVKTMFNLEIESSDKEHSVVNNVDRALVKNKEFILGSKEIDTINNSHIYGKYKDLYLSKKEREEKLLQGIQSTNGLKSRLGAKKADCAALTVTTQENAIKKIVDKSNTIPLDFDFFKHSVYPYRVKESLVIRIELNSAENVLFCTRDTKAISKISDIFLEYDAIFDDSYLISIGEMYI